MTLGHGYKTKTSGGQRSCGIPQGCLRSLSPGGDTGQLTALWSWDKTLCIIHAPRPCAMTRGGKTNSLE